MQVFILLAVQGMQTVDGLSPDPVCCASELCHRGWSPCLTGILGCFLPDELVAFLQKVASEAPGVPFYYYHIPPLTGVKSKYFLVSSS